MPPCLQALEVEHALSLECLASIVKRCSHSKKAWVRVQRRSWASSPTPYFAPLCPSLPPCLWCVRGRKVRYSRLPGPTTPVETSFVTAHHRPISQNPCPSFFFLVFSHHLISSSHDHRPSTHLPYLYHQTATNTPYHTTNTRPQARRIQRTNPHTHAKRSARSHTPFRAFTLNTPTSHTFFLRKV